MPQALYRKWRPQTWEAIIGQPHVVETLRNAIAAGRIAHAYLFAGPRGTGKTTTARILAKAVNCLEEDLAKRPCGSCANCKAVGEGRFLDLIEIDAASNTSVDDVRDLREKINFAPNVGRYKVYIVDEVHMLSTAAFNALLKTLEEPPKHAIFVLATTEVHKIPATVLSRCQRHEFRRIPVSEIVAELKRMAQEEAIQIEDKAVTLIARQSTGAMRDAISLLDQLASTGREITLEMAQNILGTAASQSVLDLTQAVIDKKADAGLDCIHAALDAGSDTRQFARQMVDYLRELLLFCTGNADQVETTPEMRAQLSRHSQAFTIPELLRVIRLFNQAASEGRGLWQPSLPLEMAFVDSISASAGVEPPPSSSPTAPAANLPPKKERQSAPPSPAPQAERATSASPIPATNQRERPNQETTGIWQALLGMVRQINPKAYGVLNSCKSHYLHGDELILNFASDIVKMQMEKVENLEAVRSALNQLLHREVAVRAFVDAAKRDAIPPGVDNDGMVASALRDLGGEIVDIQ